jgi:DNA-binding transcriptional MerR regulator
MAAANYKIGQIASRLGISVRTLRHYDRVGLVQPQHRTAMGHRLYTDRELNRLQKIVALRRMGFSLDHIRTILSGDATRAYAVLSARATQLRREIARQQDILVRVDVVLGSPVTAAGAVAKLDIEVVKKQAAALRHALVLEMHRGTDPKAPYVQALVKQLEDLSTAFLRSRGGMEDFEVFLAKRQLNDVKQAFRETSILFHYLWKARA